MNELKRFVGGFTKGSRKFGNNITIIINSVLLFVVYIIGIGVPSLLAKLFGKHFLDIRLSKKESYWFDLNLKKKQIDEYYRQF